MEQNIEQSEQIQAIEPSQDTSTSPEITPQDTSLQEVENTHPVTSLDDAKKVLQAEKKAKAEASKNTLPQNTEQKPTHDWEKRYKNLESKMGQTAKELGELRKFYQENQSVINSYKQYLDQQQEQELLNKYQSDPTAVIRELARREALQQVAPYQEQISQAQATQINASLKEELGGDYETYAPIMAEILDGFLEMDGAQGSSYASELANNPVILMQLAAGRVALQNRTQNAQQHQIAQQKKAQNLQAAQGVAKVNNTKSASVGNFGDLSLDDMRNQMKSLGIIK